MKLTKEGIEKDIKNPKVIERLKKDGWVTDEPKKASK